MRLGRSIRIAALLLFPLSQVARAQVTTTNCTGSGYGVNCVSNTQPNAQEQYQRNMEAFSRGLATLGAAIAQSRAAAAAQRAAWDSAATESAKRNAIAARANYDATWDALDRYLADSVLPTSTPVNSGLIVDWTLLDGVEVRYVQKGEQGRSWDFVSRWALTDTPDGAVILRNDQSAKVMEGMKQVGTVTRTLRFDPGSGITVLTTEFNPFSELLPYQFESRLVVGAHAFATRTGGNGYDIMVPVGTYDITMLMPLLATTLGEFPPKLRVWVVDERGEVVPADIEVQEKTIAQVPTRRRDETCVGKVGRVERKHAFEVSVKVGTSYSVRQLLLDVPHLAVSKDVKCVIDR